MPDGREDDRALNRVEALESLLAYGVDEEPSHPLNERTRRKIMATLRHSWERRESRVSFWVRFWPLVLAVASGGSGSLVTYFVTSHGGH